MPSIEIEISVSFIDVQTVSLSDNDGSDICVEVRQDDIPTLVLK